MLGAYLAAERDLGRLAWDADVATLARPCSGPATCCSRAATAPRPRPPPCTGTVATVLASAVQEPRRKDDAPLRERR